MSAMKNLQIEKEDRIMNILDKVWRYVKGDLIRCGRKDEMEICRRNYETAREMYENCSGEFEEVFREIWDVSDEEVMAKMVDYLYDGNIGCLK